MKSYLRPVLPVLLCALFLTVRSLDAEERDEKIYQSSITQVKLYQNQARINAHGQNRSSEGPEHIVLANLPGFSMTGRPREACRRIIRERSCLLRWNRRP